MKKIVCATCIAKPDDCRGLELNGMRMYLCLGDVSLIKLGMSEEEYVHLSSEVRVFYFSFV